MAFKSYMLTVVGVFEHLTADGYDQPFTFSECYSITLGDALDDHDLEKNRDEITLAVRRFVKEYGEECDRRVISLSHNIIPVPS